ncbi:hypothetical protein ES702_07195 [subsurface metagenome]
MSGFERLERLHSLLFQKHLSQKEFAAQIDILPQILSLLILGRMIPTQQEKEKIAQGLGTTVEDIFNR